MSDQAGWQKIRRSRHAAWELAVMRASHAALAVLLLACETPTTSAHDGGHDASGDADNAARPCGLPRTALLSQLPTTMWTSACGGGSAAVTFAADGSIEYAIASVVGATLAGPCVPLGPGSTLTCDLGTFNVECTERDGELFDLSFALNPATLEVTGVSLHVLSNAAMVECVAMLDRGTLRAL